MCWYPHSKDPQIDIDYKKHKCVSLCCMISWHWNNGFFISNLIQMKTKEDNLGANLIQRWYLTSIRNPIVAIRQSNDHVISTMEFLILVKYNLCIESGTWAIVEYKNVINWHRQSHHENKRVNHKTSGISLMWFLVRWHPNNEMALYLSFVVNIVVLMTMQQC